MAAPTITKTGSGSSKTTGTTLAITVTTTSYATGDLLMVGFAMDPSTGTVTFAQTAGTATIGSWTTLGDTANGSGTTGVRTILAYAAVTAAGTITTVTITHPSVTARAGETFNVNAADGTTPVNCSTAWNGVNPASSLTPTTTGIDVAGLVFSGGEVASGATTSTGNVSQSGVPWTDVSLEAASSGTSGASGSTNISVASDIVSQTSLTSTLIDCAQVFSSVAVTSANVIVILNGSAPSPGLAALPWLRF